jgi:hypothetical protein
MAQALHVVISGQAFWQTIGVAGGNGALPEGSAPADVSEIGCAEHRERRLHMNAHEETKERIMEAVSGAPNKRIRPIDLEKELEQELGLAFSTTKDTVKELVGEGELVFTYRDPCSYVETPSVRATMGGVP